MNDPGIPQIGAVDAPYLFVFNAKSGANALATAL